MQIFSVRLKASRKAKKLTQTQMADMLNIKQQSYTRYENNKGEPSLELLVRICGILDENPAYLLGMDEY